MPELNIVICPGCGSVLPVDNRVYPDCGYENNDDGRLLTVAEILERPSYPAPGSMRLNDVCPAFLKGVIAIARIQALKEAAKMARDISNIAETSTITAYETKRAYRGIAGELERMVERAEKQQLLPRPVNASEAVPTANNSLAERLMGELDPKADRPNRQPGIDWPLHVIQTLDDLSATAKSSTVTPLAFVDSPQQAVAFMALAAGVTLTQAQMEAAAAVCVTLPANATIRDFLDACDQETARQLGLPVEQIEALRPLLIALEECVKPGRYNSLFDGKNVADCKIGEQ